MARVFISYASEDRTLAGELYQWLTDDGHEIFWDHDLHNGIAVGERWEQRIHERLQWADTVVCVVTSAYLASAWCGTEIGIAQSQGRRLLPLLAEPGVQHPVLKSLHHADYTRDRVAARVALTAALRRLEKAWPDDRCPFPGLLSFQVDQHQVFFGRDAETEDLAELLRSPTERFKGAALLVVGPSGCGKSSLVRAGLVPVMAGEPGWLTLTPIMPGADPVAALVRELVDAAEQFGLDWSVPQLRDRLDEGGLTRLAEELLRADPGGSRRRQLLVVVDQFEELLTQAASGERARFAELLCPALAGPVQLVGTLRPEFLDQLLADPDLAVLPPPQVYALRPLRWEALRDVIEGPARLAGIEVDKSLVIQLVKDTDDGEALPLLAFTLNQLADGVSRGDHLSAARYEQLGGVQGALTRQADKALAAAVTTGGRSRAEVIRGLLGLVTPNEQGRPIRWRVRRDELPAAVSTELGAFVARRLLTIDIDHDAAVIGVAHEAFLSAWPPLAVAITTSGAALRARRAVDHAASKWHEHGRSSVWLWGGEQLAAAVADLGGIRPAGAATPGRRSWSRWLPRRRVLATDRVDLDAKARDFVHASIRHDRRIRRRVTIVLSGLVVVALAAAGIAVYQQLEAQHQQRIATARQLITQADAIRETDPRTALLLGIAAEGIRSGGEARASLVDTLITTRYVGTLADHAGPVTSMAFAPDGRTLVTGVSDGTVVLRDVTDPARTRQSWKGHASAVSSVAFAPDGLTLATASGDKAVILWDRTGLTWTPRPPLRHDSAVSSVAFAPDGRTLATASFDSGTVLLWDLADPARPSQRLVGHADTVFSVAYSPDGRKLATGDSDGHAVLWDLADPASPPQILKGHAGAVNSVAFAPDGRTLATGGDDSTARLWNLTNQAQPQLLEPALTSHTSRVNAVAFAPRGPTILATASSDDTAIMWNLTDQIQPRQLGQKLTGQPDPVDSVMFTADGSALDITSSDGTVIQREVLPPDHPLIGSPRTRPSRTVALAATPNGNTEVTASGDGDVMLWDRTGRARPRSLGPPLTGHRSLVTAAAFSTDGRTLATASDDGDVRLWDLTDRAKPRSLGQRLTGHRRLVTAAAFSTDGRTLATTSDDGTVVLWDLTDRAQPRPLGKPLTGHAGSVAAVAFAPDGNTLATGGFDATVILWDLRALHQVRDDATKRACAITGRGLDRTEWDRYIPGFPYQDTCVQ